MEHFWVYILRCRDGSYYTGITNNIEKRFAEHQEGIDPMCYTYKRRPVKLMHVQEFRDVNDAIACEKQIKRWSRVKKEALIRGEIERLSLLASCRNETHSCYFQREQRVMVSGDEL